ncbi:MAG: ABC transporter permease [Caldilineaceae bacterium]|nr:ABC transporter permease [Caldilineaceae bacterium]MCB0121046.1 ABC transporter permease [Caldilineaceae bacterium]
MRAASAFPPDEARLSTTSQNMLLEGDTPAVPSSETRVSEKGEVLGWRWIVPYLLATPYALVLLVFLVVPICLIVMISFWQYSSFVMKPAFIFDNYLLVFSPVYLKTYLNTFRFAAIVWTLTVLIGFPVAYFLAIEVQSTRWKMTLFLLCTVPFLTSNIIRSISWVPFLGRQGLLNSALLGLGLVDEPVSIFLFSDFSVILSMVHLYTLFMVVPVFNTMMRIDHNLLEAARDGGASEWGVIREVVLPLSLPGLMIGTIFVVALALGDYSTVRLMSGGQASNAGLAISNMINSLQYPPAAANAVVLLVVTLLIVGTLLRFVDIRKEL